MGVSTVRELKGRIKKNESIKDLGCPQPESEPTTIQAQPSRTYLCPPPPPPLVSLDLIETFKNTCSIPLFPSSSPPPHLAPDAPRGVEIGEDVLVVLDVGGKALGVDGHGVLPVLVQRLEVFFFGGGALFFGREGEREGGGGHCCQPGVGV